MWPKTDLIELLQIQYPIIQAPMAGPTTPALAAAASNAGALGSLGCAMLDPGQLRDAYAETRRATNGAINLNFFVHVDPETPADGAAGMRRRLAPYYTELELGEVPPPTLTAPAFNPALLEVLLELQPRVASFHFGLPDAGAVEALKAVGSIVLSSATTVAEARALEQAGADAIIAQGYEAGGHRGTFAPPFETGMIGTFALVPQVVDAVGVPVVAAGGIADGRGIAAAFALGASGVQIGTAFLSCPEANVSRLHREALRQAQDRGTRLTRALTGRPARAVVNRYIEEMAADEDAAAPFPLQRQPDGAALSGRREAGQPRFLPALVRPGGGAQPRNPGGRAGRGPGPGGPGDPQPLAERAESTFWSRHAPARSGVALTRAMRQETLAGMAMNTEQESRAGMQFRVGVDVGGTFTDIVLVEETSGEILVAKVATVPDDPSEGCINGIEKALARHSLEPGQFSFAVHGTTIATNTIIEGKSAKAGLITSEGFRDVLEIAYQTRHKLYDVFYEMPPPLIPRYLCQGVPERIGPDGEVLTPLDEEAVRRVARQLVAEGVEAIAVAFLHSYKDPTHERRAGEVLAEECNGLPIVLSSDVSPEYREYPRTSTAVVNTVLLPRVGPYIARLEDRLGERGITASLHMMTSAGGIMASNTAKRQPVHLVESGPAAGVIGAAFIAQLSGYDNLLALDIGGTTAKAAVVNHGQPQIADQFEVGSSAVPNVTAQRGQGYPVLTPVISLVEIGAGGGSIAHVDPGGALTVGPQSAGADPGPACYGQGGTEPTLTDANLVLGRINPAFFLGGEATLDVGLAERAVREKAAEPMGLDTIEAAQAVIEIANAKMTSALYFISVEQGIDPRDYVMVPSGGAGPMQAVAIAKALGVATVLIPPTPGLNSAVGLLATDLKHERVRTYMKDALASDPAELVAIYAEMEATIRALLDEEGVAESDITITREFDMCYVGQSFQLRVPAPDVIDAGTAQEMTEAFHVRHAEAYGFANEGEPTQFVNLRLIGTGKVDRPTVRRVAKASGPASRAIKERRPVYFSEARGMIEVDIYDRDQLLSGDTLAGPAIIEQMDSTTVVPPGARVEVEAYGNLIISVNGGAGE